jgi:zinc transporter, ZIP family
MADTRTMATDLIVLFLAGSATALATGVGAIPVFALDGRIEELRPLLWGLAAGMMVVASIVGLLEPALEEGSSLAVAAGLLSGWAFLVVSRHALAHRDVHIGELHGAGVRRSLLVLGVLFVHSLPEGFAIGTAFASDRAGLDVFILLAIGLQNIPEGTTSAIPMQQAGFSAAQQFWGAVLTSAPQPIGAVVAYLLVAEIGALLPLSFAFAAGAMLALVAFELVPQAFTRRTWRSALAGAAVGALAMLALSAAVGV